MRKTRAAESAYSTRFAPLRLQPGHCTTPLGFRAAGIHCGARRKRKDLALLVSDRPAACAGVFTTNQVQAAPVKVCREHVAGGYARAVLVNSGNANACTGAQGLRDAREMVERAADSLGVPVQQVLLCSTGLIGQALPMEPLRRGIAVIGESLSQAGGADAAQAIMTTDAFEKTASVEVPFRGRSYRLGGMAKGAGMIHPRMATTLAFVTTDAELPPELLQSALKTAADRSFNCISVDGDTSTNDTLLLLANGASGCQPETEVELARFQEALELLCTELSKLVVKDGEGARRIVELSVQGARTDEEAKQVAETVAGSLLFKTMLAGGEPNWGRVLAAAGRAGVPIEEERICLDFQGIPVVREGLGLEENLALAGASLQAPEVHIALDLGMGSGGALLWTCDLNEAYVKLNGSYMT